MIGESFDPGTSFVPVIARMVASHGATALTDGSGGAGSFSGSTVADKSASIIAAVLPPTTPSTASP